jgi:AcrR family transcriptional regulator
MHREPTNRKDEILMAALHIIAREGSQKLTMLNIGHVLGISDAALYRHFRNKHELLVAMVDYVGRNLFSAVRNNSTGNTNPIEQLKTIMDRHLSYVEAQPGIPRVIFSDVIHQNDPALRQRILHIVTEYRDYIREILGHARKQGLISQTVNLDAMTLMFLGMIQSTVFMWSLNDFQFSLSDRGPMLWRAFEAALK